MDPENKEELTDVVSNHSANESSSSKSNRNVTLESSYTTTATASRDNVVDANADADTDANVELLKPEFTCSICLEMFIKAVTLNCSHMFCEQCIAKWRNNHGKCPICRVKIKTAIPTKVVDNFIERVLESASDGVKRKRNELIEGRHLVPQPKKRKITIPVHNPNYSDVSSDGVLTECLSEVLNELREVSRNLNPYDARRYSYCLICQRFGHCTLSCPNRRRP